MRRAAGITARVRQVLGAGLLILAVPLVLVGLLFAAWRGEEPWYL